MSKPSLQHLSLAHLKILTVFSGPASISKTTSPWQKIPSSFDHSHGRDNQTPQHQ